MLYRPGNECRIWNAHDCDTRLVADEAEHLAALDEGWGERPDHEPKKKPVKEMKNAELSKGS